MSSGFVGRAVEPVIQPFGLREYNALLRDVHSVSGTSGRTALLAVARTGEAADGVPIRCLGPADVITAWRT